MHIKGKKIFSIGMVKNEVDVIESHVRYNLNIFDGMIILDNGSTDNTLNILRQLEDEGLPIYVFEDSDRNYEQAIKMNQLLIKAVRDFDADIVVPLDADEFLVSSHKRNPRKLLEEIESNTYYLVKWKTYVPLFDRNDKQKFIPAKITKARDDLLEEFYKVVIPKELVTDHGVELIEGNHDIKFNSQYEAMVRRVINPDLRVAHYPIRSKEQTISKIAIGWIYSLSRPEMEDGQGYHWKIIFDKLKRNEELEDEDITTFAKQFALINMQDVCMKDDPIDLSFCNPIKIRYTPDRIKPLSNLLESIEWLAKDFSSFKKNSINESQRLNNKIEDISLEMYEFYNLKLAEEKRLKNKIKEYENSTSWSITAPIRYLGRLIRNFK